MTHQISKVFIILCGLMSLMASPSKKKNNEEASSSTIDVEPKKVYSELKDICNRVIIKYSSQTNYELLAKYTKMYTDQTIIRAIILNDNETVKDLVKECKELGDNLDLTQYVSKLVNIIQAKQYNPSSLECFLENDQILEKMFKYYFDESQFISKSVFLDFLKNERLIDEKDKSYDNIDDQLDLQNFSMLIESLLPKYLQNLSYKVDINKTQRFKILPINLE